MSSNTYNIKCKSLKNKQLENPNLSSIVMEEGSTFIFAFGYFII